MPIDYGRLVGRTWEIFSRNRVLWVLGLIAALTGGSGGGNFNFNPGTGSTSTGDVPDFELFWAQWGGLIIILACGLFILAIVLSFVNAAAEAGLIATVDHIERTGEQPAFGLAWSMGARKMISFWLLNLVFGLISGLILLILILPVILIFAGTIAAAVSGRGDDNAAVGGLLLACLCICVLIIVLIPLLIIVSLVQRLAQRAVVLDNQGVFEALGTGWRILSENRGPTLVTWLISVVVGIIEAFASAIVLAPVSLVFFAPAFVAILNAADENAVPDFPWPLLLIGGVVLWVLSGLIGALFRSSLSTLWTVYYRNRRQMPNSDLAPAGMLPPTAPGGPSYGSPYGPTPGGPSGAPPSYPPAQGAPPPYTPPPAAPGSPYGAPPADTTGMGYTPPPTGPGGVQYGPPYSPPTAPMPPLPEEPPPPPPDERARGPEGGSGPV